MKLKKKTSQLKTITKQKNITTHKNTAKTK